ncbi:chitin-binding protein [Pseudomonas sp. NFACC23-1]|uniref:N-acetylglucosamine-binding protein GbpA n=1 Tax=unclassified Pseudomonas TaxID=196821 RepID=UPI0008824899|nr:MULTISPECIES: N-acetylglucosamine-binding protein GbpA [unclassified Pseudomonas]SDB37820.1 chitin-binding protein [Pseudomonas sp. NFACC17-2]SEJ53982.1 chitin-binding protein [Pseudomonas sp. NFACC23-1]SFW71562.1 chitin-binding protein [Pseudomonas sp. NFACC16-2]
MKNNFNKHRVLTGCASSLVLFSAMVASQGALAHGFVEVPPSRALLCQKGVNKNCGGAQYEPHSTGETFKGFPNGAGGGPLQGPIDGKIASGGNANFSALDAQSASRWHLTEIRDRNITFQWKYDAAHRTSKHEYFITRDGWMPNEELKRASFDSTPFCTVDGGHQIPVSGAPHNCVIPDSKSGHHVILAVWTVGDTDNAFYNPVDVNILAEAALPGGWLPVGNITPSTPLLAGDKVKARAFSATGENAEYSVEISIDNAEEGKPENWSFKLAEAINKAHALIRAGIRDEDGNITPVKGSNRLYAQKESGVTGYQVQLDMQEDASASLEISSLQPEYVLDKGRVSMAFTAQTNRRMNLEATLFDEKNKQVGAVSQTVGEGSTGLSLDVRSAPGAHTLTLVGTTEDGRTTRQDTQSVTLTGEGAGIEYDFVFPEGISDYTAGTKVLQPKTDEVFECKPFPASGYCKQYSPTANGFEPGVGAAWQSAWDKL